MFQLGAVVDRQQEEKHISIDMPITAAWQPTTGCYIGKA
jgi:hypothetical protein